MQEEVKLLLLENDLILYIENPKDSTNQKQAKQKMVITHQQIKQSCIIQNQTQK